MKKLFTIALALTSLFTKAQLLSWSSDFITESSTPVTIIMNANYGNKALLNYTPTSNVYVHIGVITNKSTSSADWKHVVFSSFTTATPAANCTYLGNNQWSFTITGGLRTFFSVTDPTETIQKIAILFRNGNGTVKQANSSGNDMFIPVYTTGSLYARIDNPFRQPEYIPIPETSTKSVGSNLPLVAKASLAGSTIQTYFNGNLIATNVGTKDSNNVIITASGTQTIIVVATNGANVSRDTLSIFVRPSTAIAALPSNLYDNGVPHEGITYYGCTDSVSLVLYAPNKSSSYVIGDFSGSNWTQQTQYQMYKTPDGNYYWLTIHGLTPTTEYGFQYVVDDSLYIADPYSEKILDGNNDQYIPVSAYPNPKPYPTNANVSKGKNGLIGVLQTCAPSYTWKAPAFIRPDKKNLVIEEVLVRDFASTNGNGNFKLLLDSLNYFKSLGINAIELMPVSEFSGDDSWGYNPNFYCALDKAYGTKNMYKAFIDSCHSNGIAVIMDVVYNQVDDNGVQVPEARLYWDKTNSRPAANNPWLNQTAPHPYGVFLDLNHTSTATQYWVERSLMYWLKEYNIDGFRFDLAKGFTQTQSNNTTVENFDQSRIDNLYRYYKYVQDNNPGTTMPYMILEFLAGNTPSAEENAYANIGFLLWASIGTNGTPSQTSWDQNSMGYASNSNLSRSIYNSSDEGFSVPAAIPYAGSHDDQRLMYTTVTYGNGATVKSIAGTGGALQRQAAIAAILFLAPGPKMLYQFDERGYDISINGTSYNNPHWEYLTTDANATARKACVAAYSKIISLRLSNPEVFNNTTFSYDLYDGGGLFRRFQIADPNSSGMKITVIANFDITAQTRTITFQTTGNWYNYQSNGTSSGANGATGSIYNVSTASQSITLQPGEYHVYVYQPPTNYTFIGNGNWTDASNWMAGSVPPATLPNGSAIYVQPAPGGKAILNTSQTISSGATFNVAPGKNLSVPLNLTIQ
ncbi:alpha-amylase family glycosyl hydrolase [Ferruginibacter albus]|uniref:alpha-amylase family glycosyl hydrolase n=1 Tax=Ferruginibacter albus TaxID=2875540 RepID=UPI001CC4F8C1|nr:alpha-amylase family glycosyl hydrolase [Ferruginibacter albus]UAY51596.1 hypothetical protein K9M53_13495 [Ferruginibacter albus]